MMIGWTVMSKDLRRALRVGWRWHSDPWIELACNPVSVVDSKPDYSNILTPGRDAPRPDALERMIEDAKRRIQTADGPFADLSGGEVALFSFESNAHDAAKEVDGIVIHVEDRSR